MNNINNEKTKYANKKIKELESLRFEEKLSAVKGFLLGAAGTALFAIPAVILTKWLMQVSILLGLLDLIIVEGTVYSIASNVHQIKAINDEIRHLNNIKKQGIKTGKELNVKRLERIDELENKQEEVQKRENLNMIPTAIGGIVWIGAAFGTLINSEMPMLSLVGALITTCSLVKSSLGEKEYSALQARIDNLRNDIELESVYGIESNKQKTNSINLERDSKSYTSTKALANTEDEKLVDEYLKSLEELSEEKSYQYKKIK